MEHLTDLWKAIGFCAADRYAPPLKRTSRVCVHYAMAGWRTPSYSIMYCITVVPGVLVLII